MVRWVEGIEERGMMVIKGIVMVRVREGMKRWRRRGRWSYVPSLVDPSSELYSSSSSSFSAVSFPLRSSATSRAIRSLSGTCLLGGKRVRGVRGTTGQVYRVRNNSIYNVFLK